MGVWNFKERFANMVKRKKKRQTIRRARKDGRDPKVGDTQHLFTGMRTKRCRRIGKCVVASRETVVMTGGMMAMESVSIGDGNGSMKYLVHHELDWLAQADGFRDWEEMRHFFFKMHGAPFHGYLYKW